MKRLLVLFLLVIVLQVSLSAGPEHLVSVDAVPYGTAPLGSSSTLFKFGFGVDVSGTWFPATFRNFGFRLGGNYMMLPLQSTDSIWLLSGSLGPAYRFPIGDKILLSAYGTVGYYYFGTSGWTAPGGTGGDLAYAGGLDGTFRITKAFSLGMGVSYDYYSKLYNGIGIRLSARYEFPLAAKERPVRVRDSGDEPQLMEEEKGRGVELRDIAISPLYPVLYKYYDINPFGTVRVKNFETKAAEDIGVQIFVERYMDNPMEVGSTFTLLPGEEKIIDLYALFTDDLMDVTEGTKASAKITLSYTMKGKNKTKSYTPVIEIYNRNALSWDDDRKIASFITAKDPEILGFAKNVTSWVQEESNPAVDDNLQKGMALFEAVKSYGIHYEVDPTTPFSELSDEKTSVDFLQFPRQTLEYSNGDCDDLSSLYTALLESVGVETAVITIPGHIYAAFALKASPEEARHAFSRPDELIITEDKAWVPVEITLFQDCFEKAWQTGAKEWLENDARDQSQLYPTRESWQIYQAVGYQDDSNISLPDRAEVTSGFVKTVTRFVDREIYPQMVQIQTRMQQSNTKYVYRNKLGVLYARYGLYEKASDTFIVSPFVNTVLKQV